MLSEIGQRPNFIITSFMGSSVSDLESLRKSLKSSSSDYLVVKNSMLKIVFDKLNMKNEVAGIESGMGLSLSGEDLIATCKALVTFAKGRDKFKIKSAVIDGRHILTERIRELAAISSREGLLSTVIGGIQAPIAGFVNTLGGVLRKFVYCVDAIKRAKESAGSGAPETKNENPAA